MAELLLNKLEKSRIPATMAKVGIRLPQQGEIALKTKIVDKTTATFNRAMVLQNLMRRVQLTAPVDIVNKVVNSVPVNDANNIPEVVKSVKTVDVAEPLPQQDILQAADASKPKARSKKRKKKLKIFKSSVPEKGTVSRPAARQASRKIKVTLGEDEVVEVDPERIRIDDKYIEDRLPSGISPVTIRSSDYYMNNRKLFLDFITNLFQPYRDEVLDTTREVSCETLAGDKSGEFSLLTHQSLVRDYLTLYTPYRGLLLFHGLGAGKTCSSINIAESIAAVSVAEGLKTRKQILIMTPASLRTNYISEIKKCGAPIYQKNQYWEPINVAENPTLGNAIANVFNISPRFFYKKNDNIAWLVDKTKESNYDSLDNEQRLSLNRQINEMIASKYQFLNYNGIQKHHLNDISNNGSENPFDNKVVVIDETHNFVSRIVNKLRQPKSLSMTLYRYILSAQNSKFVFLTGTPIINYPNEIAILFNMLRGYIKTYEFKLKVQSRTKVDLNSIKRMLKENRNVDYIQYKSNPPTLIITRNPHGFVNKYVGNDQYTGVSLRDFGMLSDTDFARNIKRTLNKNEIDILSTNIIPFTALPEKLDQFNNLFFDNRTGAMQNINLFKRRIMGLTSYFRSANESLMPKFNLDKDFIVLQIPMSDYQFQLYEEARSAERDQEKRNNLKRRGQSETDALFNDSTSTYRIFSRLFCNFVFPRNIGRPMPKDGESVVSAIEGEVLSEDTVDDKSVDELIETGSQHDGDDAEKLSLEEAVVIDSSYKARIKEAIAQLSQQSAKFLSLDGELELYSPKFKMLLENLISDENIGLNLIYSQFRTLEGIEIIKLAMKANGFAEFTVSKNIEGTWSISIPEQDRGKPTFALYTGTEDKETRELIRNIFNSDWVNVPTSILSQLQEMSPNNFHGEIIKTLMITSSGAEGISLKNVRFVHIIEPYWHGVRVEQVIGRARRICSHQSLPPDERNVKVFLYLMTFTQKQLKEESSLTLKLKDVAKDDNGFFPKGKPLTSDEALYEISTRKERINKQILRAIKESAVDCAIHSTAKSSEKLKCYSMGNPTPEEWSFIPSYETDDRDQISKINEKTQTLKLVALTFKGKQYAFDKKSRKVYDYDSFLQGRARQVGILVTKGKRSGIRFL